MFFKGIQHSLGETVTDLDDWQDRPTFIVCRSNAMFYQQMVHQSHSFYLRYYLDKGINVFTWNYRGYGRSKGRPTPQNFRNDVKLIYDFLVNHIKVRGKIGVYGRSLGGIPTSYISPYADMVIIDRSFCNFTEMAKWKYHSKFADFLMKIGSCGWQTQNDFEFIKPFQGSANFPLRAEPNLLKGFGVIHSAGNSPNLRQFDLEN